MGKKLSIIIALIASALSFLAAADNTLPSYLFNITEELDAFPSNPVSGYDPDRTEIYLLTGGPGGAVWENFGHSAIYVVYPDGKEIAYDWGIFTFDDTFFSNFAFGRLFYEAWATWGAYRIESLNADDRDVRLLHLDLTRDEKERMLSFLSYSVKEENRTYLYDYFRDNCATRPRDIYSWATGGEFGRWLRSQDGNETLRESAMRHLSLSTFPVAWGINYLLGAGADRKESMWEACYLPSVLEERIQEWQGNTSDVIHASTRKSVPQKWSLIPGSLVLSLILFSAVHLSASKGRIAAFSGHALLGLFHLLFSIMSSVLFFLSFFTIHSVAKNNVSLLLLSPLSLLSAVLHFSSAGKRQHWKAIAVLSSVAIMEALTGVSIALFSKQSILPVAIPAFALHISEMVTAARKIPSRDRKGR